MRRILAILLFLPALAWANDYCVASGGTLTSGGACSGGTCTGADFSTPANCYPDTHTGYINVLQAVSDGDTITTDDGTHTLAAQITTSAMSQSGATVILRCRTATPGSCVLSSAVTTAAIFNGNDSGQTNNFTFQNMKFTKTATHTGTSAAALLQFGSLSGNVVLDAVILGPVTVDWTGGGSVIRGIVHMSQSAANKTLTLQNGVQVNNVTMTCDQCGVFEVVSTNNLVITSASISTLNTTNISSGVFHCVDACTASNVTVNGWTGAESGGGAHVGLFKQDSTSVAGSYSDITLRNVTITGVNPRAAGFYISGAATMDNILCDTVVVTSSDKSSGLGGCILIIGSSAVLTGTDIEVKNSSANYGTGIYFSGGGGGTVSRFFGHDNGGGTGIIYKGGFGDMNLYSSIIAGNTCTIDTGVYHGCALYMANQTSPTRNVAMAVANNNIINNTGLSSSAAVRFNDVDTTSCAGSPCTLTVTMTNNVIRNDYAQEIYANVGGNGSALTIKTSDLTDKDDPINENGAGTLTETLTGNIETEPQFVCSVAGTATCQKTLAASPLRRAGTVVTVTGAPSADYFGRVLEIPRDIGAAQFGGGYQASSRTARN